MGPMRMMVVVVLLVASGCSASTHKHVNRIAMGAAAMALACDWGSTRSVASDGWSGVRERNPIMGPEPEPLVVDAYFLGVAAVAGLVWHLIPGRYRIVVPVTIAAVAIKANANNISQGVRVCGM